MKKLSNQQIVVLILAVGLTVLFTANRWKTSTGKPADKGSVQSGPMGNTIPTKEVELVEFLSSLFNKTKPPSQIGRTILTSPKDLKADSLTSAIKWATETNNGPLLAHLKSQQFEYFKKGNIEEVARELVFVGAGYSENETVRNYLFQQGKKWIDKGLSKDSNNMSLRNALIIYQSEFLNQPMQFLSTLRKSYTIDSNNVELNFIHLNLLKKSNQLQKAVKKCEKLVSLQPQNPYWLYETSDLYGQMGDSINAKVYLNLAVKTQRQQPKK